MPSCAARGCSARSDKGDLLKIFPRKDLRRRQIWVDRVNRPGWNPTKYSALCEVHFDRDQWELPREDGKRKLKNTAVPSIFCVEHPNQQDLVAQEHAYCILGYKHLYKGDYDPDENECEPEILPIEQIKIEPDENENFAEEAFEDKDCEGFEGESLHEPEVEDIQCTPDIFAYPEPGEPDPIETVQCSDENDNAVTSDPCNDPLAFSSDDVEQSKQVEPHFSHSKKFLFVTKETKVVVPSMTQIVTGEPVASSEPPKLKVLSPDRLYLPKPPVPASSQENSASLQKYRFSMPKLTPILKFPQIRPENFAPHPKPSPMSNLPQKRYENLVRMPKLTPIPILPQMRCESLPKIIPMSNSPKMRSEHLVCVPKLTPLPNLPQMRSENSDVPRSILISPQKIKGKFIPLHNSGSQSKVSVIPKSPQFSPLKKLKLVSPTRLSLLPKINMAFQPAPHLLPVGTSNLGTTNSKPKTSDIKISNRRMKFVLNPTLRKTPKYLHSPNLPVFDANQHEKKFNLMSSEVTTENVKSEEVSDSKPIDIEANELSGTLKQENGRNLKFKSLTDDALLENILFEHRYSRNLSWKPPSVNGLKTKVISISKALQGEKHNLLGNNHIKMWIKNLNCSKNAELNLNSARQTKIPNDTNFWLKSRSQTKPSSVVVLNPFDKSSSSESLINNSKFSSNRKVELFKCPNCPLSFLTMETLRIHLRKRHKDFVEANRKTCVEKSITDTFMFCEADKYSELQDKSTSKAPMHNLKSKQNVNCNYQDSPNDVERYENDIIMIPDINALKMSKDEFLRISNLVPTNKICEKTSKRRNTICNQLKRKKNHNSHSNLKSNFGNHSKSVKTLHSKGLVRNKTGGRRHSVKEMFKSNPDSFVKSGNKQIYNNFSDVVKRNPIVLLSRLDEQLLGDKNLLKELISLQDGATEGWKGWDDCDSNECGDLDLSVDKSDHFSFDCNTTRSKDKVKEEVKQTIEHIKTIKERIQLRKNDCKSNVGKQTKLAKIKVVRPENTKLKCSTCRMFVWKSMFEVHSALHKKSDNICKLCTKKFDRGFQLRRHVLQDHKVVKQFRCPRRDCSRSFEGKRDLDKHMRTHKK